MTSCLSCPAGLTTAFVASTAEVNCSTPCPPGSSSPTGLSPCSNCLHATFNPFSFQLACADCCCGKNTTRSGAVAEDECACLAACFVSHVLVPCLPGLSSNSGQSPCNSCPNGQYQPETGATTCNPCPSGLVTRATGSVNESSCVAPCTPGFFSGTGLAPCFPCPRGFYSTGINTTRCTSCTTGQTTKVSNSTSASFCGGTSVLVRVNLSVACQAGYFSVTGFAPCTACPIGTYQSTSLNTSCVACPANTTTRTNASVSSQNCRCIRYSKFCVLLLSVVRCWLLFLNWSLSVPWLPHRYIPELDATDILLFLSPPSHDAYKSFNVSK